MLRVRLIGRQVGPEFLALVVSGADRSLFPVEAAHEAGLDLSNCRAAVMRGVGGTVDVSVCRIVIEVVGRRIEVDASFTDNPALRAVALLGRDGVFTEFMCGFDQRAGELLVEPYP
jgi:hypothetical protein